MQTNALEYDDPLSVPNFGFLEAELEGLSPEIESTVVVMHTQPYAEQFNNNVAKVFQEYLSAFPGCASACMGMGIISGRRRSSGMG